MIVPFPTVLIDLSAEEISSDERLTNPALRVPVVGVVGAGNNLLSHAIGGGVSPSRCVAVNTDRGPLARYVDRRNVLLDQQAGETDQRVVTKRDDLITVQ